MNCKQGDLAIVIRGFGEEIGKCVTCIRLLPTGAEVPGMDNQFSDHEGAVWEIDTKLTWTYSMSRDLFRIPFASDKNLMPITPPPDADFTDDDKDVPTPPVRKPAIV